MLFCCALFFVLVEDDGVGGGGAAVDADDHHRGVLSECGALMRCAHQSLFGGKLFDKSFDAGFDLAEALAGQIRFDPQHRQIAPGLEFGKFVGILVAELHGVIDQGLYSPPRYFSG